MTEAEWRTFTDAPRKCWGQPNQRRRRLFSNRFGYSGVPGYRHVPRLFADAKVSLATVEATERYADGLAVPFDELRSRDESCL